MKHHLVRTSPRSHTFLGTCRLCGLADLTLSAVQQDCENPRGLTPEQALAEVMADIRNRQPPVAVPKRAIPRPDPVVRKSRTVEQPAVMRNKTGLRDRLDRIIELRKQGKKNKEIAAFLGLSEPRISQLISDERRRLAKIFSVMTL